MDKVQSKAKTDLTGRRFGHLVVMGAMRNEKNELVWKCRCDCGGETIARTGHLNAGTRISCGCIQKARQQDLTGKRFGRLIVLRKSEQKKATNRSILWQCRCDCGNLCLKPTGELNAGTAASCGCTWRSSSIRVGEHYGRLTAIEPTDKRSGRDVIWKCQCECGKSTEARSTLLQSGHVRSCGCIKSEKDKQNFLRNLTYVDDTCIEFLEKISVPTKASTTGVRGVTLKKDGRYKADLTFQKKRHHLGTYSTLDEAVKARKQAEIMVKEYLEQYAERGNDCG